MVTVVILGVTVDHFLRYVGKPCDNYHGDVWSATGPLHVYVTHSHGHFNDNDILHFNSGMQLVDWRFLGRLLRRGSV